MTLPPDGHPDFADSLPDPDYPIAAPLTYISGEADLDYVRPNGYLFANLLADALPDSKLRDKDVNSWLRLYTLRGVNHMPREAWRAGPYDGGATSYEFGGAGFNRDGRGAQLPAWMETLRANNPDALGDVPFSVDWMGHDFAGLTSEEGFELQAIVNADRWARAGTPPPTSAVDRNLVTDPTADTLALTYPVAEACTPEDVFGELSCLDSLSADSIINDPSQGFGPLGDPFLAGIFGRFAAGPLRYTTEPIDLPDQAVPLGFRLFTTAPSSSGRSREPS